MAEFDAQRIGEPRVARQLPAVIGLNARARKGERLARRSGASRIGIVDRGRRDAQGFWGKIDPVEFLSEFHQCGIAAGAHRRHDGAHSLVNIGGGLALGGEEVLKPGGEIAGATVETDRHGLGYRRHGAARWGVLRSYSGSIGA